MELIVFPEEEYRRRYALLQKSMAERDLQAVLLTGEENYTYFSGHRTHAPWATFTRPLLFVAPVAGEPVILAHSFLYDDCRAVSWVKEVRRYESLTETPLAAIRQALADVDAARGKVGAELGREQRLGMPVADFRALQGEMPGVEWTDISPVLWEIRVRKSPLEIECLRRACRATSEAFDRVFPLLREGMTEQEIARRLRVALLEAGAEEPGFVIMCSGAGNYARGSDRPSNRQIRPGDLVWIDLGARYAGYFSDFSRAGVVGGPTARQRELQEMVQEATRAGLERVRPGCPVAEVARACLSYLEKRGYPSSFEAGRIGHGLGLNSTEPPHVALYDHTVLEPGMAITLEPGIVTEEGIFVLEENLVVTEDGCEVLSGSARTLWTIS